MKTIAVCDADLERTPLGTRSRLAEEIGGVPLLRRTVERLLQCQSVAQTIITVPPPQQTAVAALLSNLPVALHPRTTGEPAYRALVQVARKWSLDAWRGGLGGSSALDEYFDVQQCAALGSAHHADAIMSVPPGAILIDPTLCDAMVAHAEKWAADVRMTFAQAPPGLAPTIYQMQLCAKMAASNVPPGWTLAYKPDDPQPDLVMKPACFPVAQPIRYASGRLTADTSRSFRVLRALVDAGADATAETAARWLLDREGDFVEALPREVEIELTTDDPLPNTRLRPRGDRVPRRGPLDLKHVAAVADALAALDDDALVVLGGHGEPLLHPQFPEVLRTLRRGGVYGIAVCTTGLHLPAETIDALLEQRVDVVVFLLDAWTDSVYAQVHGADGLGSAREALERLTQARQAARQVAPIVVPQFTKCLDNVAELDDFYDHWIRALGCATVVGFSSYGGRLADLSCTDMRPPARSPCRRIQNRCTVLADGTIVPCDQDFPGCLTWGRLDAQTLPDIWRGPRAESLRAAHRRAAYDQAPTCAACTEWHRP